MLTERTPFQRRIRPRKLPEKTLTNKTLTADKYLIKPKQDKS